MSIDPPPEPPVVTIRPGDVYAREFREAAVRAFGDDGAWLALSVLHYGWRAHYDLASSVAFSRTWSDDDPLGGRDYEFQIVRDLHVQGLMYATAEQLATLVDAARSDAEGGDFFETYVANAKLHERINVVADLGRDDLGRIMGVPTDVDELAEDLRARGLVGHRPVGIVDLADLPTKDIGGLLIPQAVFDRAVVSQMLDHVNDMLDGIHRNLGELKQFVERPTPMVALGIPPQSLREVDNSFRHSLRVLFHGAVPDERHFRALELDESTGTHHVDVYLPRRNEQVRFATVACSPDRTETHIETIRMLCLRMGQVIRGVLGRAVFGNAGPLVTAASLSLDGKTDTGS